MKRVAKILLLAVLSVAIALSLVACKDDSTSENAVTKMTIELVAKNSDEALVSEDALLEGETEYYSLAGYSFSDDDAKIVSRAASDKNYYSEHYNGPRKDTDAYKKEKERYAELKELTLPAAVKVSVTESRLTLTAETLAKADANGVIDLSNGSENAKTVYIRSINADALLNHTELENVTVPETYLAIGASAFGGCGALKEITLPFVGGKAGALNGAKNFGYIFGTGEYTGGVSVTQSYNLSGTATYYVPENLEKVTIKSELPAYAFHNVTTVKEVSYAAAEEIPAYAFYGCTGLKSVKLDSSVTTIGEGAFRDCSNLISVNFAELTALKEIREYAFANCSKLGYAGKTITIPASVTFIGEQAFINCTTIETLNISATEKVTVKAAAFSGLTSLETLTLNNAELSIGAFASWSKMLNVTATNSTCENDLKLAFVGAFEEDNQGAKQNIKFN